MSQTPKTLFELHREIKPDEVMNKQLRILSRRACVPWQNLWRPDEVKMAEYEKRIAQVLGDNKEAEILAAWKVLQAGTKWGELTQASVHLRNLNKDLVSMFRKKSLELAAQSQTEWNSLMDHWFAYSGTAPGVDKIVRANWSNWARQLGSQVEFANATKGIFKLKCSIPAEEALLGAPGVTGLFIAQFFDREQQGTLDKFLDRTDVPAERIIPLFKRMVDRTIKQNTWKHSGLMAKILASPQWAHPSIDKLFLEAAQHAVAVERRIFQLGDLFEVIKGIQGRKEEFWNEMLGSMVTQPSYVAKVISESEVPLTVLRELARLRLTPEVRLGMSKNQRAIKDPEIRGILEHSGQNMEVWGRLLESATDTAETGRLISYMATKNPSAVIKYLKEKNLEAGIVLPSSVLAKLMTLPEKEQREAVIGILPKLAPVKQEVPALPKRAARIKR